MRKGFTLIEMLVVIAIIAILSSVFLVGLRGFRSGALDARRLSDLQNMQSYLEVYYTKSRCYPGGGTACSLPSTVTTACPTGASSANDYTSMKNCLLASGSTTGVPGDPAAGFTYYYGVSADGQSYVLGANLTPGHSAYSDSTFLQLLGGSDPTTAYGISCGTKATTPTFCIKF